MPRRSSQAVWGHLPYSFPSGEGPCQLLSWAFQQPCLGGNLFSFSSESMLTARGSSVRLTRVQCVFIRLEDLEAGASGTAE